MEQHEIEAHQRRVHDWGWIDLGVNAYPVRESSWNRERDEGRLVGCPKCGAAVVVGDLLTDLRETHVEWHDRLGR